MPITWDPYEDDLPPSESLIPLAEADEIVGALLLTHDWGETPKPITEEDEIDDVPSDTLEAVALKKEALREASWMISGQPLKGEKADPEQPLAFPRIGLFTPNGTRLPGEVIPPVVKRAAALLAVHLLKRHYSGGMNAETFTSYTLGSTSGVFRKPDSDELPRDVRRLLAPFLIGSASWSPLIA